MDIKKLYDTIKERIHNALASISFTILQEIRVRTPIRTGNLRSKWQRYYGGDAITERVQIYNVTRYANKPAYFGRSGYRYIYKGGKFRSNRTFDPIAQDICDIYTQQTEKIIASFINGKPIVNQQPKGIQRKGKDIIQTGRMKQNEY